jgi:hypothetical protein
LKRDSINCLVELSRRKVISLVIQGGDTPVVVLMRTKEREGGEGPVDMGSLNHMTHHSLPQQMVSLPYSQPQQQASLFQPPHQPTTGLAPAAQHTSPPVQHSAPSAQQPEKQLCQRERSASTQSVEAMVCDEEEAVVTEPSEHPARSSWTEPVNTLSTRFVNLDTVSDYVATQDI